MLTQQRNKIDKIDSQIIKLLKQRTEISKEIGNNKKENGFKIKDSNREKEILSNLTQLAKEQNLDENYINKVFKTIITNSREVQEKTN